MLKRSKIPPALTLATIIYLLCSLLAVILYPLLPPILSSVGARIHYYLLMIAAFEEATPLLIWLIAVAHVALLAMLWSGIRAIRTGRWGLFCALVGLDILLTFVLHHVQDIAVADYTAGVWVNLVYYIWLFITMKRIEKEELS